MQGACGSLTNFGQKKSTEQTMTWWMKLMRSGSVSCTRIGTWLKYTSSCSKAGQLDRTWKMWELWSKHALDTWRTPSQLKRQTKTIGSNLTHICSNLTQLYSWTKTFPVQRGTLCRHIGLKTVWTQMPCRPKCIWNGCIKSVRCRS